MVVFFIKLPSDLRVGYLIVEHEQQGKNKAQYGKESLKNLAGLLTKEFGKGFDASNLRRMRQFYLVFPNCGTVSTLALKNVESFFPTLACSRLVKI